MALNDLLEYQKVDAGLRNIELSIASSDVRKKYMQAKKFLELAKDKLENQEKRAVHLQRLRDELEARCAELLHQIEEYADIEELVNGGGDLSFYKKNAQALLDKIRSLKAELEKLTKDMNAAVDEYKELKKQTITMQKQYRENGEKLKEVKGEHAEEMTRITAELNKLAAKVPAEILEKYKAKRKEGIFPILAPLTSVGGCMCGMELSLAQQGKLSGGNVIECEHCRRFIYKL